jgi:hypothetical protein
MPASDSISRLTCTRALVCNERDQACGRSSKSELHAAVPEQQQDEYCEDCRYSSALQSSSCPRATCFRPRGHKFVQLLELGDAVLTSQCHTVAARARLTATGFYVKLSASNKHAVPMPAFENSVAVSVQYVNALSICMIALVWRVINVLPLLLLAAALVCMYVWKPAQAAAAALFKPAHKQHTSLLC